MEYITIYRHEDAIEHEAFEFNVLHNENTDQVIVQGLNEYGRVTFFYALMPGDYFTVEYLEDQDEDPRADADSDSKVDADADSFPRFDYNIQVTNAERVLRDVADSISKLGEYRGLI